MTPPNNNPEQTARGRIRSKQNFRNVTDYTFTGLRLAYIHSQQQGDK